MIKSAMILAAGLGTRMRPLTRTLPKPLLSVGGKSMLERTFEHLQKAKISHIVINTHYLASLVIKKVNELCPNALISHEDVLLETGGGIKKALSLLDANSFFVLNGDSIWSDSDSLRKMEKSWNKEIMDALLLLIPREEAHGYEGQGDFFMSSQGHLRRPDKGEQAPYVYIGVQLLNSQLFQNAPHGPFSINLLWDKSLMADRLYGHIHRGEWFHMSTPQDLERYALMIDPTRA